MYYEVENTTDNNIEITLSGVTYKLINIPANRILIVEKPEGYEFIDPSGKLIFKKI